MTTLRPWLACLLLFAAPAALGARIEIPLRVPLETVRQAFAAHLAASPTKPGEVYREGPCRHLTLEPPAIEADEGRLRLTSNGVAALGAEILGRCQSAADWRGAVALTVEPRIDEAGVLRVRVIESKLVDARGTSAAPLIWELSKRQLHPRLERFGYDLGASRNALLGLLREAAPASQAATMEAALQRIEVATPRVEAAHIVVPIALEVADAWLAAPQAAGVPAGPLTEAEVEALENALAPWDAFLAYSIRQIARDGKAAALRKRLFTLLLDSRYRLSDILSGEATPAGDPVRALFLETWDELRAILGDAQRDGLLDPALVRYAAFIDAGDALVALDSAVPGLGMHLSAEGLRQLARGLRPGEPADPLAFDWSIDAELRELFDVEELREEAPRPRSSASFFLRVAQEAETAGEERALDRWVPKADELAAYEKKVGALLAEAAAAELQRSGLAGPHAKTYGHLLPTTALIESCWRHYVTRAGKVTYLRSQAASVGIMQINQRVWRGFYDVERLRWDMRYNIRAGAQILMRYVRDYAIPHAQRTGKPEHVARAAYAVYNAGPRAAGRFAKATPHPREARVDDKLWMLYQGIASGGQPDLRTCGVKNPG